MTTVPDPPPVNLQELIDMHIQCMIPSDGQIKSFAPTLIVKHFDPSENKIGIDVMVLAVDFNEPEEKRNILEGCGRKYYDEKKLPIGIALASEAWMSKQLHVRPSESDDRKEVIIVGAQGLVKGKGYIRTGGIMPLNRDKDGNIKRATFMQLDNMEYQSDLLDHFYSGFFGEALKHKDRR